MTGDVGVDLPAIRERIEALETGRGYQNTRDAVAVSACARSRPTGRAGRDAERAEGTPYGGGMYVEFVPCPDCGHTRKDARP